MWKRSIEAPWDNLGWEKLDYSPLLRICRLQVSLRPMLVLRILLDEEPPPLHEGLSVVVVVQNSSLAIQEDTLKCRPFARLLLVPVDKDRDRALPVEVGETMRPSSQRAEQMPPVEGEAYWDHVDRPIPVYCTYPGHSCGVQEVSAGAIQRSHSGSSASAVARLVLSGPCVSDG